MSVTTIDGVLEELDLVIERAVRENSRNAYFAVLYRNVTARVKQGIAEGRFEDGPRMEQFDVIFANRYLDAIAGYRSGGEASRCWMKAFKAADWWSPLILQHLLLGMNAHINLDLGIAAAETCQPEQLPDLKPDFDEINDILGQMIDEVQLRIADVSPWMGVLDHIGCRTDETISGFCLRTSRNVAWNCARKLARTERSEWPGLIRRSDRIAASLAMPILKPTVLGMPAMLGIRCREPSEIAPVVEVLR